MPADFAPLGLPTLSTVLLVLMIVWLCFHPFIAVILAAAFFSLGSGLGSVNTVKAFQRGFDSSLGSTEIIVGLGAMLSGFLLDSGGADWIAEAFTRDRTPA